MKQLLIVKSSAALNGGAATPKDLSGMAMGSLGVYHLDDPSTWLAAAPTKDFAIVLGRGANSNPIIIPEVDFATVKVVKSESVHPRLFSANITIPTVVPGKTYTLVLTKNDVVPHERNTWTATHTVLADDTTTTAANVANILGNYFKNMANSGALDVTVNISSAQITITGKTVGEGWNLVAGDALYGTTVNVTPAVPNLGGKKYIQNLASQCAAGKGFTDVYPDGVSIYPGYPEEVEDIDYHVYTLRFAVGRKSAKTRDERVSQLVHIAVPIEATSASSIDTIIGGIKSED